MASTTTAEIAKPKRWDVPFGEEMTTVAVEELLKLAPFRDMTVDNFPRSCSLSDLLLHDTRLREYQPGDLIVREGDYGNSAFLVVTGEVRVVLESLSPERLGRPPVKSKKSFWSLCRDLLTPVSYPEVRDKNNISSTTADLLKPLFLQDVPGLLDKHQTLQLGAGEIFGELAALGRTPRTATVFAESEVILLEIRWQGLRDLMKYDTALKSHLDQLYRQNSLESHLRETPFFNQVPPDQLRQIAEQVEFLSYGQFEWFRDYQLNLKSMTDAERLEMEPIILTEAAYAEGIYLVRSGFVRVTHKYGQSERTSSYLHKGQFYGLAELSLNWQASRQTGWLNSLRAVGYVDLLRIPTPVVEEFVLPTLSAVDLGRYIAEAEQQVERKQGRTESVGDGSKQTESNAGLLEFLVDQRYINGTKTMLIDMNRCTRCDDCVRACSDAHGNNPRFLRSGPTHEQFMVAHACMHCLDPVCMIGCPTGAIHRDATMGTVLINDQTCIGCTTCANSCPYDNIQMVEIRNDQGQILRDEENQQPVMKATKCDLCHDLQNGPACQNACPHDALVRISTSELDQLEPWTKRHAG
ncbi:Electron transport protein HydN [Polystyrenella longa]|uniref:Electron transport protein HydN n=1 Tax=Polystyrenella longa TaxID=2528007 RepID=A0A518CMY0_9PLAN|nr:cyclic nucleotide-binding domain-containing protein [Polystyrenella longa]QDU80575.1 Electron transport protein HydN [Polystyrenella longa]